MKAVLWLALMLSTFELSSCQKQDIDKNTETGEKQLKILFIGNSLTYTNDLPALVRKEGKNQDVTIKTEMIAYPNYALEDHWNDGKIQARIEKGGFDYVVVQQGPSSQSDGREMLLSYGSKIAAICKKADARLVFFMVWPARANLHTFDGVITNYRDAASESESLLCPVGEAWKKHIETTGDFSFYGDDGFHPSLKGSEVAAQIITDKLLSK
jgi:hypothetical protein